MKDELMKMLSNQIADEEKGVKEYSQLIEKIQSAEMGEDIKLIAVVTISKIRAQEELHKSMLTVLQGLLDE
jgi:rubrerythrin